MMKQARLLNLERLEKMTRKVSLGEIEEAIKIMEKIHSGQVVSDTEHDVKHKVMMALAALLPSPSKLNAASVMLSNSADKIAKFLEASDGN